METSGGRRIRIKTAKGMNPMSVVERIAPVVVHNLSGSVARPSRASEPAAL